MPVVDARQAQRRPEKLDASVIVPCYQSAPHIRYCLRALLNQKTDLTYEILVVDSSTDGTDEIVATEFPAVRLIHSDQRLQVGPARNRGVAAATGDILLFADSDTVPGPTWLEQMCSPIRNGSADAVGGSMRNGTPESATGSAGFYLEFFRFLAHDADPHPAHYLVGGNSAYRREILQSASFADSSVGEDMLFSSRLAREGKKLLFVPRASVEHRNRVGIDTVFEYQEKLGSGAFLYRSVDSPVLMRVLGFAPALIFVLPFFVLAWIGGSILRRRQFGDLFRYVSILPVCFAGNTRWARGFYQAVVDAKRAPVAEKRDKVAVSADRNR